MCAFDSLDNRLKDRGHPQHTHITKCTFDYTQIDFNRETPMKSVKKKTVLNQLYHVLPHKVKCFLFGVVLRISIKGESIKQIPECDN